ncbi:DUF3592 domain-containing protein [Hymenobacter yonginensis]|uniref:DUF3592 domain-containing protein n=1 Tax=Hymenobacter yonginensis TaxID=748197 RepID=A0ABY7PUH7_9BACT|nr:DUF3592 domain-containing protein [Hymenobacter yonginensis]WBO86550.1 hypothetical protein O9Z63_09865 [Hymenobacter yonginensis]
MTTFPLVSGALALAHLAIAGWVLRWLWQHYRPGSGTAPASIVAEGTIVALETDAQRWLEEFPVVRFQGRQGQWLTLRCHRKCRAARFITGQKVTVRYPAPAPEQFVILSRLGLLLL